MKIWKNTDTLNGFDKGLTFTDSEFEADILLLGSKSIDIKKFSNLKGIFRAGIGRDNVPEKEALKKNIVVKFPSKATTDIIYDETASFACNLIFRMLYSEVGQIDSWSKKSRLQLSEKQLLVLGVGKIGSKVRDRMKNFMSVVTFDLAVNDLINLDPLIRSSDCISIHIPMEKDNISFFDKYKLSMMKNRSAIVNTSRGAIVNEEALYQELKKNRLKAAFDVFWNEPYNGKLKEFYPDPFFMTPHVASTCSGFLNGCREDLDDLIRLLSKN